MKKTINFSMFCDAFYQSENYKNKFSYEGLAALFDHLERQEEEFGEEFELDVIALVCDYSEFDSVEEINNDFKPVSPMSRGELEDKTIVIPVGDKGFIIQNF